MYLECDCSQITLKEWEEKMKGTKPISYKWLVGRIRKKLPELYCALGLNLYNPYCHKCRANKKYYILVHSSIEYFILKH